MRLPVLADLCLLCSCRSHAHAFHHVLRYDRAALQGGHHLQRLHRARQRPRALHRFLIAFAINLRLLALCVRCLCLRILHVRCLRLGMLPPALRIILRQALIGIGFYSCLDRNLLYSFFGHFLRLGHGLRCNLCRFLRTRQDAFRCIAARLLRLPLRQALARILRAVFRSRRIFLRHRRLCIRRLCFLLLPHIQAFAALQLLEHLLHLGLGQNAGFLACQGIIAFQPVGLGHSRGGQLHIAAVALRAQRFGNGLGQRLLKPRLRALRYVLHRLPVQLAQLAQAHLAARNQLVHRAVVDARFLLRNVPQRLLPVVAHNAFANGRILPPRARGSAAQRIHRRIAAR